MIFGNAYNSSIPFVNEYVPCVVEILQPSKKFRCLLCKRVHKDYRSIFYHIAVTHRGDVFKYETMINDIRRRWLWT